jgi:hypothetical protein
VDFSAARVYRSGMRIEVDLPESLHQFATENVAAGLQESVADVVVEPLRQLRLRNRAVAPLGVEALWNDPKPEEWSNALSYYWVVLRPEHVALELDLNSLTGGGLAQMDADGGYQCFHALYFPWKYSAANRLATNRGHLERSVRRSGGARRSASAPRFSGSAYIGSVGADLASMRRGVWSDGNAAIERD